MMRDAGHVDHVARKFDIDGPLVAQGRVEHAIDLLKGRLGSLSTVAATVSCSKTFYCVSNSRTLWCSSGLFSRSLMPGAPLITTTGDFSANAPAVVFATFSPPTQ